MNELTQDELVALALAGLSMLSIVAMFLHAIFLRMLRTPFLRNWLLQFEVNAEVAAMNQSVRRAYALAGKEPPKERHAIEAALKNATPGSRQQQQQQQGGGKRPKKGGGGGGVPRVAGLGSRGGREAPDAGAGQSMSDYAPMLILAEAKAETSKADDRSKGQNVRGSQMVARGGARGKAVAGGKGVRADRRGRATMVYPGDGVYEGEYVDSRKEGKGKFWYVDGTVYEGSWRNDEKHGKGRETYSDGAIYEGSFEAGSRHGVGVLTYANSDVYEGSWFEDTKHGFGTFRWAAGTTYEGDFVDGVMHGRGTYHFADGCTYQGEYADGKRNGRGVYRFLDGSFFEGEYRDGVVEGRGTFTFADGSAEVGRWQDGRPVGEATRFSPDHRNAWRLFDGQVTGPVSLDLADVIAQMAFRPKAARLARAVRDQLAAVHMEEERRKYAAASPLSMLRSSSPNGRSRSPSPLGDRPAWQGVMDVSRKATPLDSLTACGSLHPAGGAPPPAMAPTPGGANGYAGVGGASAARNGGSGGAYGGRFPVAPPSGGGGGASTAGSNGGYPTFASIISSPKGKCGGAAGTARRELLSLFSPKKRSPGSVSPEGDRNGSPSMMHAGSGSAPPVGSGVYMA